MVGPVEDPITVFPKKSSPGRNYTPFIIRLPLQPPVLLVFRKTARKSSVFWWVLLMIFSQAFKKIVQGWQGGSLTGFTFDSLKAPMSVQPPVLILQVDHQQDPP